MNPTFVNKLSYRLVMAKTNPHQLNRRLMEKIDKTDKKILFLSLSLDVVICLVGFSSETTCNSICGQEKDCNHPFRPTFFHTGNSLILWKLQSGSGTNFSTSGFLCVNSVGYFLCGVGTFLDGNNLEIGWDSLCRFGQTLLG